jgi:hypothetical protein
MKDQRKVIGLNLELANIVAAINAVRPLIEGTIEDRALGTREALAVLSIITARIELVRAVIRREVDPAIAWGDHCATVAEVNAAPTDDPELRLPAWTEARTAQHARALMKRHGRRRTSSD